MTDTIIYIDPVTVTKISVIAKMSVGVSSIDLRNQTAKLRLRYFNENDEPLYDVKDNYIDITKEEYSMWGTDDRYILELVCQKLEVNPIHHPSNDNITPSSPNSTAIDIDDSI